VKGGVPEDGLKVAVTPYEFPADRLTVPLKPLMDDTEEIVKFIMSHISSSDVRLQVEERHCLLPCKSLDSLQL